MYPPIETMEFYLQDLDVVCTFIDDEIGVDFEITDDEENGTFNLTIFDVETTEEFNKICEIEERLAVKVN